MIKSFCIKGESKSKQKEKKLKSKKVRNLLEEPSAQDLLVQIRFEAQQDAKPIQEAIKKSIETHESDTKVFRLLQELKGVCLYKLGKPVSTACAEAAKPFWQYLSQEQQQRLECFDDIIFPDEAVELPKICPWLFENLRE